MKLECLYSDCVLLGAGAFPNASKTASKAPYRLSFASVQECRSFRATKHVFNCRFSNSSIQGYAMLEYVLVPWVHLRLAICSALNRKP